MENWCNNLLITYIFRTVFMFNPRFVLLTYFHYLLLIKYTACFIYSCSLKTLSNKQIHVNITGHIVIIHPNLKRLPLYRFEETTCIVLKRLPLYRFEKTTIVSFWRDYHCIVLKRLTLYRFEKTNIRSFCVLLI